MYTVWHVDKYKITFKLVSSGLSRPGIIDARAQYRPAARRLRNTALDYVMSKANKNSAGIRWGLCGKLTDLVYADDICLLAHSTRAM
jgi:hypothetical protein